MTSVNTSENISFYNNSKIESKKSTEVTGDLGFKNLLKKNESDDDQLQDISQKIESSPAEEYQIEIEIERETDEGTAEVYGEFIGIKLESDSEECEFNSSEVLVGDIEYDDELESKVAGLSLPSDSGSLKTDVVVKSSMQETERAGEKTSTDLPFEGKVTKSSEVLVGDIEYDAEVKVIQSVSKEEEDSSRDETILVSQIVPPLMNTNLDFPTIDSTLYEGGNQSMDSSLGHFEHHTLDSSILSQASLLQVDDGKKIRTDSIDSEESSNNSFGLYEMTQDIKAVNNKNSSHSEFDSQEQEQDQQNKSLDLISNPKTEFKSKDEIADSDYSKPDGSIPEDGKKAFTDNLSVKAFAKPDSMKFTVTESIGISEESVDVSPPQDQVKLKVIDGLKNGQTQMKVSLNPESLGRVDVEIQTSTEGKTKLSFSIQQAETLALLKSDTTILDAVQKTLGTEVELHMEMNDNNFNNQSNESYQKSSSNMGSDERSLSAVVEIDDTTPHIITESKVDIRL